MQHHTAHTHRVLSKKDKDKRSSKARTQSTTIAAGTTAGTFVKAVKPLSIAALPPLPPGQAYRTQEEECSVYDADSESQEQRRKCYCYHLEVIFRSTMYHFTRVYNLCLLSSVYGQAAYVLFSMVLQALPSS
jgi:hypothetical protein